MSTMAADPLAAPRRMRAPERREAILAAARREFALHGFHGAGTAAIAREAGCSEAILYRHFASKKALLTAVLRAEVARRVEGGDAIVPPPGAAPVSLADVLASHLADGDLGVTARLVLLTISMSGDPEMGEAVREGFNAVRGPVRTALAAGQAAGVLRDDIDAESLTWMWHGLFLVALVRNTLAEDGVALGAVGAARELERVLAPPAGG
jgi:AcrR family transcriptional regulator